MGLCLGLFSFFVGFFKNRIGFVIVIYNIYTSIIRFIIYKINTICLYHKSGYRECSNKWKLSLILTNA